MLRLAYHQPTLDLLDRARSFSPEVREALDRREAAAGAPLPASVREWYSLEGAVDVLRSHSNSDDPVPIDQLGTREYDLHETGPHDYLADGLMIVIFEDQAVCTWAVRLDGTDDPPVVIEVDSRGVIHWQRYADTFSDFVCTWVWDYPAEPCLIDAVNPAVDAEDLAFLRANFTEHSRTHAWPGAVNYRFSAGPRRIFIRDGGRGPGSSWMLAAPDAPSLRALAEMAQGRGALSGRVFAPTACGKQVLATLNVRDAFG